MKVTVLGLPEPRQGVTAAKDRPRYERHAGLSSIEANLKKARAKRNQWDREVNWLEGLLEKRQAEVEAGEWPYPPEPERPWPPPKAEPA